MREHERLFGEHRRSMLGAAYRILGSLTAAEDAVQEVWPRWAGSDLDTVRDARAYLVSAATRQALNAVRAERRRRESYVGPWLPEPLDADAVAGVHDPAAVAERADSVSLALLVVLESLTPAERAAFVLRDVFGLSYAQVGATLDRSPDAARQLAHRARGHVRSRAPRHPVDPRTHRDLTARFLAAAEGGSLEELLRLLAPDAVLITDAGGRRKAALRPIHGAAKVAGFLLGVLRDGPGDLRMRIDSVNGAPAVVAVGPVGVDTVAALVIDDGLVTAVHIVRNPEKLRGVRVPPGSGTAHDTER